ncbi:cation diffusion facilitator family transporter [Paenibacillus thermotolerans]|uniref:cation diffusion facilitator family transporter n=1 Tax=Paenibacillus thermotolerans TaxID=3027807 RepID=UPI002368462B|nr:MULTISPECIES: cation diffusion facilitator family transporter [unclassified Paenibacillus]
MDPEPERENLLQLIKKGNKSSAIAMIGNAVIAIAKGIGAALSGSGAMFASAMHSLADSINQGFVFVGSILAEKKPTRRFPTGFGRVINIFCMIAVIVVTIMAYETIREGLHLIQHPASTSGALWLNVFILLLNLLIDGGILIKAMKEIVKEARVETKGLSYIAASFKNVGRAAPPTRLVFYEDLVAVTGALLAMIAVVITSLTAADMIDGVVTILIGILMVGVAFRVGYDNMVGLIGVAAPRDVAEKVTKIILSDKDVTDINSIRITQEGRYYHVDAMIELRKGLSLADADDIKFRIQDKLIADPDITDVVLGIIEDNGVKNWTPELLNDFA